jgi:hypothetical protein
MEITLVSLQSLASRSGVSFQFVISGTSLLVEHGDAIIQVGMNTAKFPSQPQPFQVSR